MSTNKLLIIIAKCGSNITKNGMGFILTLNDESYVITCYHGIKNSHEIVGYTLDNKFTKYNLSMIVKSCTMDLALLKIDNRIDGYTINDLYRGLPTSDDLSVNLYKINYNNGNKTTINIKKYEKNKYNITYERLISFIQPELPYINIIEENPIVKENRDFNFEGTSGSIALYDKKIIGIFSSITNDGVITLTPSLSIIRFLNEYIKYGCIHGLCYIYGLKNIVRLNDHNIGYGLKLEGSHNIKHNKVINKNIKLMDTDIIYKINNLKIDSNCCVDNMPITTYIALNYMENDTIPLKILRTNSKKEHTKIEVNLKGVVIEKIKLIPEENNMKFVELYGLIFTEISEELLKDYYKKDIILVNEFIEKINKRPFSSNRKIIVIVDINRDRIDREILNIIDELKFPLINIEENKYVMPELVKVNNIIIKNLKELSEIARLNIENISLKTYKKQKINIGVNNRLVSIVKK